MLSYGFQIGSSASLDVEVHGETTSAVQEVKVSPTVIKSKKATSLTAKLKSPAPVGRAKKFSLDKSPTEKGLIALKTNYHSSDCYLQHPVTISCCLIVANITVCFCFNRPFLLGDRPNLCLLKTF